MVITEGNSKAVDKQWCDESEIFMHSPETASLLFPLTEKTELILSSSDAEEAWNDSSHLLHMYYVFTTHWTTPNKTKSYLILCIFRIVKLLFNTAHVGRH